MSEKERRSKVLTDEDIELLAERLKEKMKKSFYQDLGRGVWGLVWRAIIIALIAIAASEAGHKVIK